LGSTSDGTFNFTGGTLKATEYLGDLTNAGGTFAPGQSTALSTISGNYTQDANSRLQIEIGGMLAGEYDRLEVSGVAMIGGTLDISLVGGFVPSLGDSFGFLFANGGFGGNFSDLVLPDLSPFGLDWLLNPGGATLFLNVIEGPLAGDLDGDGFVGIADLNILLTGWNQNVTPGDLLAGDPTGDGFVGIEDLNAVLGNWNAGSPPGTEALALVPEPGSCTVLLAISGYVLGQRSRIRRRT